MTDRESIDYVKNVIENSEKVIFAGQPANEVKLYTTDKGLEMLKRVVGLAEREPCEDMINRKHLLSEIDDLMKSPWFNRYRDDCGALHFGYIERKEAVEIVRDLCVKTEPPVQPKTKTGHWIVSMDCEGKTRRCTCNLCGYKTGQYTWKNPNFCEDCGAKMVEPREEDIVGGSAYEYLTMPNPYKKREEE